MAGQLGIVFGDVQPGLGGGGQQSITKGQSVGDRDLGRPGGAHGSVA